MNARRAASAPRLADDTLVLIGGDADDVVAELVEAATARGVRLLTDADRAAGRRAHVVVMAVRSRERSSLAAGLAALTGLSDQVQPDAIRLVVAVRAKLTVKLSSVRGHLIGEILYQVAAANAEGARARMSRRWRTRIGAGALDAAGLHVFRVRSMVG